MAITDLTSQLNSLSDSPPTEMSDDDRKAFLAACERARRAVENPLEATVRLMFGAFESVAVRLAVDMKLIDLALGSESGITAEQLASGVNADVLLVVRVMRMLVAMSIFKEIGHHTYVANPMARAFATGSPLREAVIHVGSQIPPVTHLPEYFEEKGYRSPTDAVDGPFQFTYQNKQHFFDWLDARPRLQSAFNATMKIQRMERGDEWFEFYPVEEKLQVQDSSDVLLVDVGGSVGHDLINFQNRFPKLPGKLIFTDLPAVVGAAQNLPDGIEGIGHDFLKTQPVKNAKAYYLRTVLHDWPDKQARTILEHVRDAMGKDSILLINENALPEDNVALYQAELDILMMSIFASLDRTAKQFEELLDSVGLKVIKVWKAKNYGPGSGTLFEAVLKE